MYQDKKTSKRGILLAVCLCLLAALGAFFAFSKSPAALEEEAEAAIREAVRAGALQCYVVEGFYPPDLAYLQDHYGLQVNTEDYYVVYDAFASNVPPTVSVVRK